MYGRVEYLYGPFAFIFRGETIRDIRIWSAPPSMYVPLSFSLPVSKSHICLQYTEPWRQVEEGILVIHDGRKTAVK